MNGLKEFLNQEIRGNPDLGWTYKEFGKQVERPVIDFLLSENLLKSSDYIDQAANKNAIPDILDLQFKEPIFIDIKAGNVIQYATGNAVSNPNNDLSTSFRWKEETLLKFDGENCYFIEIKYHHRENEDLYVTEAKFDKFYKFVGKTPDGFISTRRRNIRTKGWNQQSQFNSAAEFEELLDSTISNSIKKDFLNNINDLNSHDALEIASKLNHKVRDYK